MSDNCAFKSDGYHDTATKGLQGCKEANNTYMNGAITELHSLVKDIRADPKKYLNVKVSIF